MKAMKDMASFTGSAGRAPRFLRRRLRPPPPSTASWVAVAMAASTLALSLDRGGGRLGVGAGPRAAPDDVAMAGPGRFLASLTAFRLLAPRTGVRGVNIQPIPGMGLPPMRR